MHQLANYDEPTPMLHCNSEFPNEQWKCFELRNSFTEIEAPILMINSQYDSWSISNTLQIKCLQKGNSGYTLSHCSPSEKAYIETYRTAFNSFREDFVKYSNKNSVWSISCSQHGYAYDDNFYDSPLQRIPGETGLSVRGALLGFVRGERVAAWDEGAWPSNGPCAM